MNTKQDTRYTHCRQAVQCLENLKHIHREEVEKWKSLNITFDLCFRHGYVDLVERLVILVSIEGIQGPPHPLTFT